MNNSAIFRMNLPDWLDKTKIEKAIKHYLKNENIQITEMTSQNAVPVGDNYTSDLFRTTVKYIVNNPNTEESISLIIKCAGDEGAKDVFSTELKLFEKETSMFGNILKKLHSILEDTCLAADCLLTEVHPKGLIIMQDLKPLGYKMADRQKGLDMDHCFLVLEKLAKLHASSAVLYEKDPQSMKNFEKGLLTNQHDSAVIEKFVVSGFQSLIVSTSKWPGYEKYGKKISAMMDGIFKKSMDVGKRNPNQFNVLNHGDLWTNNIMFLYNSTGRPTDLRFVDFQFSLFSSPAVDLQYFISTSPKAGIEKKHLDRLLGYYYEQLVENLKELRYPDEKIPTYQEIYDDFRERGFYAVTSAATVLPLVRAPSSSDATFEELSKEDNDQGFRKVCYNCEVYRERMEELLPYYDSLALFD